MDLEELTLLKVYGDTRIEPFVPSGTEIILIQNGEVSLGKIFYGEPNQHSLYIDHPKNQDDIVKTATELIYKKDKKLLKNEDMLILTCPTEIIKLMIWEIE